MHHMIHEKNITIQSLNWTDRVIHQFYHQVSNKAGYGKHRSTSMLKPPPLIHRSFGFDLTPAYHIKKTHFLAILEHRVPLESLS